MKKIKEWAKGVWLAILGKRIIASGLTEWHTDMVSGGKEVI